MADTLPEVESGGFSEWLSETQDSLEVSDAEARSIATQLLQETLQIVNEDQIKAESELNIASATQRRSEAGSFWELFLKDPQAALGSAVEKAFPGDSQASSLAKDTLKGMMSGQFDPESSLAAYANSSAPTGYSTPSVVSSLGDGFPTATKGLSRFGKRKNGPTQCSRHLATGTVRGLASMVTGSVTSEMGAVSAAQQTVAGLSSLYKDLTSYLMTLPAEAIATLLTDKVTLLENIESKVDSLLSIALSLDESDYAFDHRSVVIRALAKLKTADDDLSDVFRVLFAGGNFQPSVWDRAEGNIQDAADILLDTDLEAVAGTKQLRIVMGLSNINTQLQVLLCRQTLIERIYSNLANFSTTFQASARFDNLFGPPIDQIRCLLQAIIGEMESLLERGLASAFFVKEKQWYLELQALLAFMSGAGRLSSSVSLGSSGAQLSANMKQNEDDLNSENDFTALTFLIEAFAEELRAIIFKPANSTVGIENLAVGIKGEISTQKGNVERIEEMIAGFKGSFGNDLTQALSVAGSLVNYLQSKDLKKMVNDIVYGDIGNFFRSGPKKTTKEEEALENTAKLLRWVNDNRQEDSREITKVYNELRSRVRSDKLLRRLTTEAADEHIRDVKEKRLPKNNRIMSIVRRFNASLRTDSQVVSRDLFINERLNKALGRFSDVESQVKETVIRATQNKPISCSSL